MSVETFTYNTIDRMGLGEFKDRGSKFYGYVYPVINREEALACLQEVKDEHKKARHHCFAWRIGGHGQDYRIADDGEPSGSAGQPIFNQLLSEELTNIVAIVVRYFGGTKLGVPGLINAYRTATYEALRQVTIKEKELSAFYQITSNYDHAAMLMTAFKQNDIDVLDAKYDADVTFHLRMAQGNHESHLRRVLTIGFQFPGEEMVDQLSKEELDVQLLELET